MGDEGSSSKPLEKRENTTSEGLAPSIPPTRVSPILTSSGEANAAKNIPRDLSHESFMETLVAEPEFDEPPATGLGRAEPSERVTFEHPERYRLAQDDPEASELGRGGLGRVFIALDTHLGSLHSHRYAGCLSIHDTAVGQRVFQGRNILRAHLCS